MNDYKKINHKQLKQCLTHKELTEFGIQFIRRGRREDMIVILDKCPITLRRRILKV